MGWVRAARVRVKAAAARPDSVGVVADDLTGALECGAALLGAGFQSYVGVDPEGNDDLFPKAVLGGALSVNTATRLAASSTAQGRVFSMTSRLRELGYQFLYKKLDSTLRGQVGREVAAFMEGGRSARCLVAGAHPRLGRAWVGDQVVLSGDAEGWGSGAWVMEGRVGSGSVPTIEGIVTEGMDRRWKHVRCAEITGLHDALRLFDLLRGAGVEVITCEAEREEQLRWAAAAALETGYALAGSGGLLEELGRVWEPVRRAGLAGVGEGPTLDAEEARKAKPQGCVVVIGSQSALAQRQERALMEAGRLGHISVSAQLVEAAGWRGAGDYHRCMDAISQGLDDATVVVIGSGHDPGLQIGGERATSGGMSCCAQALAVLARERRVASVVVVGGETAYSICTAMGVHLLVPISEANGVVYSRVPELPGLAMATKAGGFGNEGTLEEIVRVMLERRIP